MCSANPLVLRASVIEAREHQFPLLIESTCNQVNQFGGYTGMDPKTFVTFVKSIAEENHLPESQLFLGGDHIGPSVWKGEPSASALDKSLELVRQYVRAGYKKIHFDASMPCADDPDPLPAETISAREALLCAAVVEECEYIGADIKDMVFVVGTEVPTPGGTTKNEDYLAVSSVVETQDNIEHTRKAFFERGLTIAWEQTCAFVVQPGVEFSDSIIHSYDSENAKQLSSLIENYPNLIYEAHSTDYQTPDLLKAMVRDHYAILKVGPALTFALREGIFALESIERELLGNRGIILSNVSGVLDKVMCAQPDYWKNYYPSDLPLAALQRKFSFLDRSRYYWANQEVNNSVDLLIDNLSNQPIALSLLSQFLPLQYGKIRMGALENSPLDLLNSCVSMVIADYIYACGLGSE